MSGLSGEGSANVAVSQLIGIGNITIRIIAAAAEQRRAATSRRVEQGVIRCVVEYLAPAHLQGWDSPRKDSTVKEQGQALVQYIFLDVVRFTEGRSIEAQVDVIQKLNSLVLDALDEQDLKEDRILLPTGDGMAIAIFKSEPFDLSLKVAQRLLSALRRHNEDTTDEKRRFQIRIGVNQNIDNIVIDINGNRNVVGRGINMAQRIMDHADGGQIAIGGMLYEVLRQREQYENAFRELPGGDKHGNSFPVYQLIRDGEGLNTEWPTKFKPSSPSRSKLSYYVAHFISNAAHYHDFLSKHRRAVGFDYASTILLHLLTLDSMDNINKSPLQNPSERVKIAGDDPLLPTYKKIQESEFWVRAEFSTEIAGKLTSYGECFEDGNYSKLWAFPSEYGKHRVQNELPEIWKAVVEQGLAETIAIAEN
jgi:class 3 adenylate cyclase